MDRAHVGQWSVGALCVAVVAAASCGPRPGADASIEAGDVNAQDASDTADSGGACPAQGAATSQMIAGVTGVTAAAAGDLDGDGRIELVVVPAGGGVAAFTPSPCGFFAPFATALAGVEITGVAIGRIDASGPAGANDVVVFARDRTLIALSGRGLRERWRSALTRLSTAGDVVTAHLATDASVHHVAAFDADHANLLRVENTGSGWTVRAAVTLPPGIDRVFAGNLGQNARDELVFVGGGLAEVVSVADFDFSDVRFLSMTPHSAATFGDFNGDSNPDVALASGANIRVWAGDGNTRITAGRPYALANDAIDLASIDRDADGRPEVAVLESSGVVDVVHFESAGGQSLAMDSTVPTANRVFSGRVDSDPVSDLVITTTDDRIFVWRSP